MLAQMPKRTWFSRRRTGVRLHRLRPKTHAKAAEALQLVLELPLGLRSEVRAQIVDALSSYSPDCWSFIMIGREKSRILLQLIVAGPRPGTTLAGSVALLRAGTRSSGSDPSGYPYIL
jgi:hypothetical protein